MATTEISGQVQLSGVLGQLDGEDIHIVYNGTLTLPDQITGQVQLTGALVATDDSTTLEGQTDGTIKVTKTVEFIDPPPLPGQNYN